MSVIDDKNISLDKGDTSLVTAANNNAISVVGYSLRAPNASSVPEFARALRDGKDLTTSNTRVSHKQAEAMDPLIRMLLEVSYEALMDSQCSIRGIRGSNTGVYVGHCFSDDASHKTSAFNPDKNGYELVNGTNSMAANRLSYFYDFKGPSLVIDTACSSSLVALHYAIRDMNDGIIERAVVAGLSFTSNPHKNESFAAFKMLSPTGHCHVFDERADGYCRSDGVVCLILERSDEGYATIVGSGVNSDGYKAEGITFPSASIQSRLMKEVLMRSPWIEPKDVRYHEAHGTGTVVGDRVELEALRKVYSHNMVIGSVKSNMGHAEGASGLVGIVKILLMMEDKLLYPNYGFESSPHASINDGSFTLLNRAQEWVPGACSASSFGFGGTNAFVLLVPSRRCISSKSALAPSCRIESADTIQFAASKNSPAPISSSIFFAKQRFLGNHDVFPYDWKNSSWQKRSPLVFVFNGQGSQWKQMGADLIKTNSSFRTTMERLQAKTSIPLIDLYKDGSQWLSKDFSTIGVVSFQLGALAILREKGIQQPDYFLGHSVGEIICPFVANLVAEEEVLQYAVIRTQLAHEIDPNLRLDLFKTEPMDGYDYVLNIETSSDSAIIHQDSHRQLFVQRRAIGSPKDPSVIESFSMHGTMVVFGCSVAEVNSAIVELRLQETRIACYNSPQGQTISGATLEVEQLIMHFQQNRQEVFIRRIDTDSVAYHAIYLKIFREYLSSAFGEAKGVDEVSVALPAAWISTSRNKFFNVNYLIDNILRPVYFQEAIEQLPPGSTILEIGPSSILLSQIKRIQSNLQMMSIMSNNELDNGVLEKLQSEWPAHDDSLSSFDMNEFVSYNHRYPRLWGRDNKFHILSWNEFELPNSASEASEISYDLTRKPWKSIRAHFIRNQNLFPSAGFLHAFWHGMKFQPNVEILNFRIHTPLVISSVAKVVKLHLYKAGNHFELWDDSMKIQYATATVQISNSPPARYPSPRLTVKEESLLVEGSDFYSHIRKLGYEYGLEYQQIARVGEKVCYLHEWPMDWICYIDTMLHLRLFNESHFGYPIGFDRVYFGQSSSSDAPLWVLRPQPNSLVNDAVRLEGLHMEYLPIRNDPYTIHEEVFLGYTDSDDTIDVDLLAALICRESTKFSVREPLLSTDLIELSLILKKSFTITQDQSDMSVVLSDCSDVEKASLIITVDSDEPSVPCCLVARWGNVKAYRCHWSQRPPKVEVITDWKSAAQQLSQHSSFVWKSRGASGAVASLEIETKGRVKAFSCESYARNESLSWIEKGMRFNYINEDGVHGVFVSLAQNEATDTKYSDSAMLTIDRPGHLSSLRWKELDPSNHSVQVKVATLNFRDVMRALGQLKEKDLSIGLEFSGYDKETKQRVFGVTRNAFASHCSPVYTFQTPSELSDVDAATIPVAYLTAYYALFYKANLKEGQSVLIHAGTGGVGMAAIRLAQCRGLNVFTTCSSAKRQYLKSMFELEDHQIGDSRSEAFVQTVLAGTNNHGVDAALNQLKGRLQIATLQCMAEGGQFLEIGKYDILQNTALMQGSLAANISFHVIDLLPLLHNPKNHFLWDEWLKTGFSRQEIIPLPTKEFHHDDIETAFRYMSQAKHKGKIAVTGLNEGKFRAQQKYLIQGDTHLITGGLGGLGISIAARLASDGVTKLYLVGRSGVTTGHQRNQIALMEAMGCQVNVIKADVQSLNTDLVGEVDVIWHTAIVYNDALLYEMSEDIWNAAHDTKVKGYLHLKKSWPTCRIIAFSSVAAYFGNALQTSYSSANATIDYFAREKSSNLLSIRLGPLDNVGFVTKSKNNQLLFKKVPFQLMSIDGVLDAIMQIASKNNFGVYGVYDLKDIHEDKYSNHNSIHDVTETVSSNSYTLDMAQSFISVVLGGNPGQYKPHTSLKKAGLDSLSTMEVINYIHKESGKNDFKPSEIDDSFTVQSLVDYITHSRGTSVAVSTVNQDQGVIPTSDQNENEDKTSAHFDSLINTEDECLPVTTTIKISPKSLDFSTISSAVNGNSNILILRQANPHIFNHGAPIDSDNDDAFKKFIDDYVSLASSFETTKTTVITVVEGEVRGGGMLFPAVSDLCLATEEATFGLPEIHRNMVPSVVSKALIERLGRSTTRRLSLTGESFNANEALRIGLVDRILKSNELDEYISGVVRRWESQAAATKFIKKELIPRLPANSNSMGTKAGTWLTQRQKKNSVRDYNELLISIDKGVATLTMCDKINANTMSFEMTEAIRAAIPRLKKEAKVIILTSSLNHFHAGINPAKVREWKNQATCHVAAAMKECYMGFVELSTMGIPLIAILNGKVWGGGLPIALWCDYRIATYDVDVHFGNMSRGMSPAGQLSQLLREYLSPSEIMEIYLENSHWNADDLLRRKIVSSVAMDKEMAFQQARKLASFIVENPTQGIRDTFHLTKVKYAADIADEESWLIAKKITSEDSELFRHGNESFVSNPGIKRYHDVAYSAMTTRKSESSPGYGIIAIEVYTPSFAIEAETLERHNILAKTKHGQEAVAVWDSQEDSISMAMTAVSRLLKKYVADPYSIGRLEVGSESNVDMAKSIKSYLMDLFPPDHVDVEGVDNVNACYGSTAALLNTLSWSQSTGRHGIVVATDTADMDLDETGWRGASAVAILVGPNPWVEIHPERTSCFKNTHDFLKPKRFSRTTPIIKTKDSMNYYVEALDTCIQAMNSKHGIDTRDFDAIVFHGGLCTTFMKIIERHLMQLHERPMYWNKRFDQARAFATQMGGLYTASLYVNLLSLLHGSGNECPKRIGLFAYGSGSTSTLMWATIHSSQAHPIDLGKILERRRYVSFETLNRILKSHELQDGSKILEKCEGVYYRDFSQNSDKRLYMLQSSDEETNGNNFLERRISSDKEFFATCLGSSKRIISSLMLMIGWVWWILSAIIINDLISKSFILGASLIFLSCALVFAIINVWMQRSEGWLYMLIHYLTGDIVFVVYATLLMVDTDINFLSIYIGWYTFDSILFIIKWNHLSADFCTFLSIHHPLSLLCTGTWIAVGGNWSDMMRKAVTIWLTSDVWHYSFCLYRLLADLELWQRLEATQALKVEQLTFWLERLHRIVAYTFIFFVEERSVLVWLIFGTGLLFDAIDGYFRILSIRTRKTEMVSNHDDIEAQIEES